MTDSIDQINAGVPYVTGDPLPAATINTLGKNAECAFATHLSRQARVVTPSSASGDPIAVWTGAELQVSALATSGAGPYFGLEIELGGTTRYVASTGLPSAYMVLGHNAGAARFDAMRRFLSNELYVSTGETLGTFAAPIALTQSIVARAYFARAATSRFFVGAESGIGKIIEIGAATVVRYTTNSSTANLTDIIGNGTTGLVAVGIGGVSRSVDSGVNWIHGTMSYPATVIGVPCVTWDSVRAVFIASVLLADGSIAWSTSATGASWQAFRQIAGCVTSSVLAAMTAPSAGMAAFNGVWVAPHVSGTATNSRAGLLVSIDAGASWRRIPGGAAMMDYNELRVLNCDGQAALISQGSVLPCGAISAYTPTNSTAS